MGKNNSISSIVIVYFWWSDFYIPRWYRTGHFSESLLCKLGMNNSIQNPDELLKSLEKTPISCKNVTFTIFGLSLATFNAFLSIVISYILLKLIMKK